MFSSCLYFCLLSILTRAQSQADSITKPFFDLTVSQTGVLVNVKWILKVTAVPRSLFQIGKGMIRFPVAWSLKHHHLNWAIFLKS